VASSDPFRPVTGDDIGPTGAQRARSGLSLVVVLVALGIVAAGALGMAVVLLWAVFTAALG
jgi:hypothetical protein